jgi:hypothetical protein
MSRRAAFGAIGAAAAAVAAACGGSPTSATAVDTSSSSGTTSTNATCAVTPTETIGPYPSRTEMVRSDVRENRQGTTLTLTIRVVNVSNACAAVVGADVEIWHCDVAGDYSQYGSQTAATFLRGIQTTNAAGEVTFTTICRDLSHCDATRDHDDDRSTANQAGGSVRGGRRGGRREDCRNALIHPKVTMSGQLELCPLPPSCAKPS